MKQPPTHRCYFTYLTHLTGYIIITIILIFSSSINMGCELCELCDLNFKYKGELELQLTEELTDPCQPVSNVVLTNSDRHLYEHLLFIDR